MSHMLSSITRSLRLLASLVKNPDDFSITAEMSQEELLMAAAAAMVVSEIAPSTTAQRARNSANGIFAAFALRYGESLGKELKEKESESLNDDDPLPSVKP